MHEIYYNVYPEKVSNEEILKNIDDYIDSSADYGNCGKLHDITSEIFENEQAARDYIEEKDTGSYDTWIVRIKERNLSAYKESKRVTDLREIAKKAEERYFTLSKANHFSTATSELIACKGCKSKISREKLVTKPNPNCCPVCGSDMRPESTLKRIQSLKDSAYKRSEEYNKVRQEDINKKCPLKIAKLVKWECHI